jgi:hypothetical protein
LEVLCTLPAPGPAVCVALFEEESTALADPGGWRQDADVREGWEPGSINREGVDGKGVPKLRG